jgi:general secretion pathway protein D
MRKSILMIAAVLALLMDVSLGQGTDFDPFSPRQNNRTQQQINVINSVQFVDAPITDIFTMISDLTGWSIIMSPEISRTPPKINIWVKNLLPEQILEQVLNLADLVMERKGNTIRIMTFNEYARIQGLEKKVISLKYAQAGDIAEILIPFVEAQKYKILPEHSGNKIILLVPKPLLESMEQLVATLDTPFQKDEVKVIPLKHLEASFVAPALDEFLTESVNRAERTARSRGTSPGTAEGMEPTKVGERWLLQFMVEPKLNVIVLRGHPADVAKAIDLIKKLDVPTDIQTIGYELKFTNARDAFSVLQDILKEEQRNNTGRGRNLNAGPLRRRIAVSEQNNRIIVEGAPEDHDRIAKIITAIDKPLPPGSGGMRIYRLENTSSSEVVKVIQDIIEARSQLARQQVIEQPGSTSQVDIHPASELSSTTGPPQPTGQVDLTSAATGTQTTAGDMIPAIVTEAPEINAVIIKASAAEHEEFARVIGELDQPRDQVIVEITMVLVRNTSGFDLGLELSGARLNDFNTSIIGFSRFGIGDVDSATGDLRLAAIPPFGLNWAIFNAKDFSFVLNALQTVGETRISSAPKILIQDNSLGQISQVTQEPYETSSQGESSTITSFGGFVDAGTVVNVIPHISDQNWLRMEYSIQLSSFGSRTAQQLAANLPPPRTQIQTQGTVRIPAEHVIVIGGLISKRIDKNVDEIPLLSDIPLVGELFRNRSDSTIDETLFIFIHPVVLRDPGFKDLLFLSERETKKAKLFKEEEITNPLKIFTPLQSKGKEVAL